MASPHSNPDAQYAPPPGRPPSRHHSPLPTGTPIPSAPDTERGGVSAPPVQQAYSPAPGGAYPQYSPYAPQSYPQGYPSPYGWPGVPGYPSPAGQYPPTFGQYQPPPGLYPSSPGQYPPPTGQYPPTGAPTEGQYSAPVAGPPAGPYPPPGYQMPSVPDPNFPGVGAQPSYYQPGNYPVPNQPPWYLGTPVPDPRAPAAQHGVQKVPGYDPALTYDTIVKVLHSGHDDKLSSILLSLDVFKMDALCDYTISKTGQSLQDLIDKHNHNNPGSSFRVAVRALTLGPLGFDVELAHKALVGFGTNEMLLTELILGRSGAEIRLLIEGYRIKYGKDLVSVVKSDLSGKHERMFVMALNGQRPPDHLPVNYTEVEADIETLHHASKKKEEVPFFEILINRSNPHIAAVVTGFSMRYKNLSKVIKKTFSGHIESSLLYIMHGAKAKRDGQGFWRDAKLLEKSMAGLGTRDTQLIYRLIRAHWNPNRLEAIKDAYRRRYGKPLENRVKGETSGDYQRLLVAIVRSSETRRV